VLIEKPKAKADVEEMRWQVRFDTASIYIRKHRWYLLAKGRCIYLDENSLCVIYARRPRRCRDHNPPECERYGKFYDVLMTTPEQLDEYLAEKGILRKLGLRPLASGG